MKLPFWTWALLAGIAAAVAGWFLGGPASPSSQEGIAALVKARQFAGLFDFANGPVWWDMNFLGGSSPLLNTGYAFSWFWLLAWDQFFPDPTAVRLAVLSLLPLGAVSTCFFVKELSGKPIAGLLGTLVFLAMPALWLTAVGMEKIPFAAGAALTPWVFLCVLRLVKDPTPVSAALLGVACSALVLTNWFMALTVFPGALVFFFWGVWKYCGIAPLLAAKIYRPFVCAVVVLAAFPMAAFLRESAQTILYNAGQLRGWREAFSTKSLLQLFDWSGSLSGSFRADFSPPMVAGSFFLGSAVWVLLALVFLLRKRIFPAGEISTPLRVAAAGFVGFYWLSFGVFSPLSGTLRSLAASSTAPDFTPAVLWGLLVLQGVVLYGLLPPSMPLRRLGFILLAAIFFLVPGFDFLSAIPLYSLYRAPMEFLFVGSLLWIPAIVGMGLLAVFEILSRNRAVAGLLVGLLAGLFLLELWFHGSFSRRFGIGENVVRDFQAAAGYLGDHPGSGSVIPVSGRYFYLELPGISGRPLLQEAFFSSGQARGLAHLLQAGETSMGNLVQAWTLAGAQFVLLDLADPDFPEEFASRLRERFKSVYGNPSFEVLEIEPVLAPAFGSQQAALLELPTPENLHQAITVSFDGIAAIGPGAFHGYEGRIEEGNFLSEDTPPTDRKLTFQSFGPAQSSGSRKNRFSLENISPEPEWMIATAAWHPDWQLFFEGKPYPVLQAFGGLLSAKGIPSPGVYDFQFIPPWWYLPALGLSSVSWILVAMGLLFLPKLRTAGLPPPGKRDDKPVSTHPKQSLKALVITPTYNEAGSLGVLLKELLASDSRIHVLVVDDSSPDGTAGIVREHPEFKKRVHLMERSGKLGLGSAYREGFRWAAEKGYDACLEIDADLSHDPKDVPRLLEKLEEGYDAVIGSRYLNGLRVVNWPEERLLISSFATQFVRFMLGMPLTDATSGFKALRVRTLENLNWDQIRADGYGFQVELHHALWKAGAKLAEIPIVFTERREGKTKMTAGIAVEAAKRVMELVFDRGSGKTPHRTS